MAPKCHTVEVASTREIMVGIVKALSVRGYDVRPATYYEQGAMTVRPPVKQQSYDVQERSDVFQSFIAGEPEQGSLAAESGRSSFTARFVRNGWDVEGAILRLDNEGYIEAALEGISEELKCGRRKALDVLQYTLWKFAKGWVAERAVEESIDRYVKASESNDMSGQDFYDREVSEGSPFGPYKQLKAAEFGRKSRGTKVAGKRVDKNGVPVFYHQFDTNGTLHVSENDTVAVNSASSNCAYQNRQLVQEVMW